METIFVSILVGVAITLIAAAIVATAKHISNSEKHPCKKDIVFSDVCEPKMQRMADKVNAVEDCLESEVRDRKEAFQQLREYMKEGFEAVSALIKGQR